MAETLDAKGELTNAFNKSGIKKLFKENGLKIGFIGGVLSFLNPTVGFVLIAASVVELNRRDRNNERVWCDPKPQP